MLWEGEERRQREGQSKLASIGLVYGAKESGVRAKADRTRTRTRRREQRKTAGEGGKRPNTRAREMLWM